MRWIKEAAAFMYNKFFAFLLDRRAQAIEAGISGGSIV
jgi:hypothetical protein